MHQTALKVAPGSPLHRLLRITPGYAPQWLCDNCLGFDLLLGAQVGLIIGSLLLMQLLDHWWPIPVAVLIEILFFAFVHAPFANRERWGRASRRRGECVWCGRAGVESGNPCKSCGNHG